MKIISAFIASQPDAFWQLVFGYFDQKENRVFRTDSEISVSKFDNNQIFLWSKIDSISQKKKNMFIFTRLFDFRFGLPFWVKLNWTTNNNKFSENPDWALSQVLYGALFGLAILFIAVWTDFGFVLDFIFGLPSFFSKKKLISFTKDRPSQQLDLSEIEGDISLGKILNFLFI